MAVETKTRGARRKRPLVPWRVPTLKGLDDLRREVRTLTKQPQILRIRPKPPTRPEIEEIRRYFLEMAMDSEKTLQEAFNNVVEKLKGSAFALGVSGVKQMYYRDRDKEQPWRRREGAYN